MASYTAPYETRQSFKLCHGFNCTFRMPVGLDDKSWKNVMKPFKRPAKNAEKEREKMAAAIALIETYTNEQSGLAPDRGKAETFKAGHGQMDCIDEAVNTTRYLRFLDEEGVLVWHEAREPVHRGYIINGIYPHNAGAVREKETRAVYVIDSYYFDNGEEPAVVPLDIWLDNWRPAN
ncbi:MAG: hypothetical protein DHS20C02_13820 [Micavibrio sp.]|nr:MAG: hypothetical protein DHS20C02_13820 [Micavibrio sp.]